jgi:hypothetical protein
VDPTRGEAHFRTPLNQFRPWINESKNAVLQEIPYLHDGAVQWPNGGACIAINTKYFPAPPLPSRQMTYICDDGLWGHREYTLQPSPFDATSPHLAFFPVAVSAEHWKHRLFRTPHKLDYEVFRNGPGPDRLVLTKNSKQQWEALLKDVSDGAHYSQRWIERMQREHPALRKGKNDRVRLFFLCQYPNRTEAAMRNAFDILAKRGLLSRREFLLVWCALQRAIRELIAYTAFCSNLVPSLSAREEIRKREHLRDYPRRGSIFGGKDILEYLGVFINLNMPCYAELHLKEYRVEKFDSPSPARASIVPHAELSVSFLAFFFVFYLTTCIDEHQERLAKDLPPTCLPPPAGTQYFAFEAVARGMVPRGVEHANVSPEGPKEAASERTSYSFTVLAFTHCTSSRSQKAEDGQGQG